MSSSDFEECIICAKLIPTKILESHVNDCINNNTTPQPPSVLSSSYNIPLSSPALLPPSYSNTSNKSNSYANTMYNNTVDYGAGRSSSSQPNAYSLQLLEANAEEFSTCLFNTIQIVENQPIQFHKNAAPIYNNIISLLEHITTRFNNIKNIGNKLDNNIYNDLINDDIAYSKSESKESKESVVIEKGYNNNSNSNITSSNGYNNSNYETIEERDWRLLCELEGTCNICTINVGAENIILTEDCGHRYCEKCIKNELLARVEKRKNPTFNCPINNCEKALPNWILKKILTLEQQSTLEKLSLETYMSGNNNFSTCPKCSLVFECVSSQNLARDVSETGIDGKPLTKEALEHRNQHRFRCPNCAIAFCSSCKEEPYHLGFNCEKFKSFKEAKHCRYCDSVLNSSNTCKSGGPGIKGQVCTDEECQVKAKGACAKVLPCSHFCCGVKGEKECCPCLEEDCKDAENQNKDEYCSICYSESLGAAPCIQLNCGHVMHYHCAKAKLDGGRPGARLTFAFLNCPLCSEIMDHPTLEATMAPMIKLFEDVKAKSIKRLEVEGMKNDPRLSDPDSLYYKKPLDYALKSFAYYPCFKCKQPYFGGKRACEEAKDDNKNEKGQAEEFDASHLVCSGCADATQTCKTHGAEFIEWKCKFCCQISSWYCWGTTHFCDDCHKKQVAGDYVTKKTIDQLPRCNPKKCILNGVHKFPPLTEQCLGCSICKSNNIGF